MSVIDDHVRYLDTCVDRFQAVFADDASDTAVFASEDKLSAAPTISTLSGTVRALSANSTSRPQLTPAQLLQILQRHEAQHHEITRAFTESRDNYIAYLSWIIAAKAAVQTFSLVTNILLDQTMPLSDGIYYWDDVLGSPFSTGLYAIQTSPLRLAQYVEGVYQNIRSHGPQIQWNRPESSLSERWDALYRLVRESIRRQSLVRAKTAILSPFGQSRSEARRKRRKLKRLREMNACAVGILMEEGLLFEIEEDETGRPNAHLGDWQDIVLRSTLLMRSVLQRVNDIDSQLDEFEDNVFTHVTSKAEAISTIFGAEQSSQDTLEHSLWVIQNLRNILEEVLPQQQAHFRGLCRQYGRPSRVTRYWLPASALLLSSSTILNVLTNRRAELLTWVCELGATVRDFWRNWVIDPLSRLIGTIRHDEKSEIALMGRQSLKADLDSLERMVVDFAVDRPETPSGYSPAELDRIRAGVKEGDLTPVLTAYERDLRKPFVGTVRGDLVRALLIQVQKTKVDVEIAISGIDAMLKSQELFFGFIALTPGILVSYAALQWVAGFFGSRRGIRQGKRRGEMLRSLRAVDRVLTASEPLPRGVLSYKDHGLLLCEVELLRQRARQVLPGVTYHEFQEDLAELLNVRVGVERQRKVLERIRWAYRQWIH
ncbi:hypothetical protein VTO42DRAFT_8614 [Malbranchea cinnamomea]